MPSTEWQPGFEAEEHFLRAARRLGYREVQTIHPFVPSTIRKTARLSREDRGGVDFFLTQPRDRRGWARPVVPLQLTLAWDGEDPESAVWRAARQGLEVAQERNRRGFGALFWPVPAFSQDGAILMLRKAAEGNRLALKQFGDVLSEAIDDFFARRDERILRIAFAVLAREARNEEASWSMLERFAPRLASHVRREIVFLKKRLRSPARRMVRVRRIINAYREASRFDGLEVVEFLAFESVLGVGPTIDRHITQRDLAGARAQLLAPRTLPAFAHKVEAPVNVEHSLAVVRDADTDENTAWQELNRVKGLLSAKVRREIKKINRSGRSREECLAKIRHLL